MKLPTRLGTATLAGMFALSAVGAAQTEDEAPSDTPTTKTSPSPSQPTGTEPTDAATDPDPQPPPTPSQETTTEPPPLKEVDCVPDETRDTHVVVSIPEADSGDIVELAGVDKLDVDASSQVSLPHGGQESLDLVIWDGEVEPIATCSVSFSLDETEPPDEPTEDPTEETPNPSETPSPEPEPEPEPTEDPTSPESTPSATSEPTQSAEDPSTLPSQPQPTTSSAPVEPAPPQNTDWGNTPTQAEPLPQPTQESSGPVERNIRQYSNNPRHLLSQMWNTDSNNGSGLIMPSPRDNTAEGNDLETLPPVSEDELNAIKARVSTPDKGNGLDADDMLRADVNERLTHSDTWWIVSSVAGLAALGAGVWWAVARRKPKH